MIEARKASLAEIEKSRAEAQAAVAQNRLKADSAITKINLNVEEARKQAGEEILRAKTASADEVKKARKLLPKNWPISETNWKSRSLNTTTKYHLPGRMRTMKSSAFGKKMPKW